jgi:hypothetical protein
MEICCKVVNSRFGYAYTVWKDDKHIYVYDSTTINKNDVEHHVPSEAELVAKWDADSAKLVPGIAQNKRDHGNSALVAIGERKYVFIGDEIMYEFETPDPILEFFSPIDRLDSLAYPLAFTAKNIYFLVDRQYVSLNHVPDSVVENARTRMQAYIWFYRSGPAAKKTLRTSGQIGKK